MINKLFSIRKQPAEREYDTFHKASSITKGIQIVLPLVKDDDSAF